jgi:O-antigen ligase
MRKITFWLTLLLIFTIPWEDTFVIGTMGSLTRVLGLAVAGCWFMTIVMQGHFRKPQVFHALVLMYFCWCILSYMWTSTDYESFERVKTYAQIFVLMLIVWEMLQTPEELMAGLQAYVLGAFVPIASSLNNYMQGNLAENYEVRFTANGVNAVDLALFLLLGLPIAWRLFTRADKKNILLKLINLAYLPMAVFTILLTASRTSLFAIVPAVIFIGWPKKVDFGRIVIAVILLILSILVLRMVLPASVIERLASVTTSIKTADIGGRVSLWLGAIGVFLEHPIIGSGAASLTSLIGSIAHQTFLSVLAETGLVGFTLFMIVIVYLFNYLSRLPKGQAGLWISSFMVWCIGVLSLSFEFRKITWLFFSFMIIEGYTLQKKLTSQKVELGFAQAAETRDLNEAYPAPLGVKARRLRGKPAD